MATPRWLEAMLPLRPGQRIPQPYPFDRGRPATYRGLQVRTFSAAEVSDVGAARAFLHVEFREGQAQAQVVLDLGRVPCPLLAVALAAHEQGHVLEQANSSGLTGRLTAAGTDEQEDRAWQFARAVSAKFLTEAQLVTCLDSCAMADRSPQRCRQAEGGRLDELLERVEIKAAPLHPPMLEAVARHRAFFAQGQLSESDRKPARGGGLLLREALGGRIHGPVLPERAILAWVTADGQTLDPAERLWSAEW